MEYITVVKDCVVTKYHHGVLPKGKSFTANSSTKDRVLPKGRSFTASGET